ncbi:hypothetical protein ACO0RG_001090 [Hanseniaspora osmophila]|uniref:Pro-apoptotic serine protease NMA111 n=1 Tax=Hanseniaspora osmophila TaxID=56408 RepID=A0A1E5RP14_9ASCO|nr:Pro-apoptotic serine protease [Hanseniaspora osmophila]
MVFCCLCSKFPSNNNKIQKKNSNGNAPQASLIFMSKRKYQFSLDGKNNSSPKPKHLRVSNGQKAEQQHEHQSVYSDSDPEDTNDLELMSTNNINAKDNSGWHKTISKVVQSVVSINFIQLAFDADESVCSEATGFVVDAKRGYILTNRHVVSPGPLVNAYAIFNNHEECELTPIYRDPVHDYGVFKFDPKKLKYMELQQLELKPSLANVGLEIRVVGNDAGEKLSILSGFISRLDRNAPDYGEMTYNDFNTEYIQAAASASGGSSGSPVVNKDGYAVALQAGGSSQASTDFFLPLDRVHRTLTCLQQNKPITRGTIQTQWLLKPYDECRRLGLSADKESLMRENFPDKCGLLVAETVLKEGPASELIAAGDILISINEELITSFIQVDRILDESVGKTIELLVQRSGKNVFAKCTVGDLHAITPSRYVEVCGASFHELSYQMARLHGIPVSGVFLNSSTGSFDFNDDEDAGWIIDQVDNNPTPNLDVFIDVMSKIPDKKRVICKYHNLIDPHTFHFFPVYVDRHWFKKFKMYTRNDETGVWDITNLADPIPSLPSAKKTAKLFETSFNETGLNELAKSIVMVSSKIYVHIDSFTPDFDITKVAGLVVDAELGLVIVSRIVVPHNCLEVFITIANSIIVPAKVLFLHPTKNYAIVQYNAQEIDCDLQSANLAQTPLVRNCDTHFLGCTVNDTLLSAPASVANIAPFSVGSNVVPRYRGTSIEGISINCPVSQTCSSGILCDKDGIVRALWLLFLGPKGNGSSKLFFRGLDVVDFKEVVTEIQKGIKSANTYSVPSVYTINADVKGITLLKARISGVSDEWIGRMEKESSSVAQFMAVSRVSYTEESDSLKKLQAGDIILSKNGALVKNTRDIMNELSNDVLELKVVRNGEPVDLQVKPFEVKETDSLVIFSGCLVQEPHNSVLQCVSSLPSKVYISDCLSASPASQYGVASTNFITHVNEQETPDLDTFIKVIKEIPDKTYCKMNLVTFESVPFAISLKTNYHYFPTSELHMDHTTNEWSVKKVREGL